MRFSHPSTHCVETLTHSADVQATLGQGDGGMVSINARWRIVRWSALTEAERGLIEPGLDAIFFEASGTKTFADAAVRSAFRERWLGRYLSNDPDWAYVVLAADGPGQRHSTAPVGYLTGCLEDPATTPRFADIAYFRQIGHLTARYPAHLHINFAPEARSMGLGSRLIARFAEDTTAAGAIGMHVVTGRGMRNVDFYLSNGFREAGAISWNDRDLVFLARSLTAPGSEG